MSLISLSPIGGFELLDDLSTVHFELDFCQTPCIYILFLSLAVKALHGRRAVDSGRSPGSFKFLVRNHIIANNNILAVGYFFLGLFQ